MSCSGVANPDCDGPNPHMFCFGATATGPSANDLQDVLSAATAAAVTGDLQDMSNNGETVVQGSDIIDFASTDAEAAPLFNRIQQNFDFSNSMAPVGQGGLQHCLPLDCCGRCRIADKEQQKRCKEHNKQHREQMKAMGCPGTRCKTGKLAKSSRKKKAPAKKCSKKKKCPCKKQKARCIG